MRIAPILVARPPKARAVDVTSAPADIDAEDGSQPGLFRPVVTGPLSERRAALERLMADGLLVRDAAPQMFVYRVVYEGARWVGLVCAVDTQELHALASPGSTPSADEELAVIGWQTEPAVIQCRMPDEMADYYINDTNERPAYHFVAGKSATHSAWVVRDAAGYTNALAQSGPQVVIRGAHRLMAAHRARVPALAILTRDLAGMDVLTPALAPRCGLFVATATLGA